MPTDSRPALFPVVTLLATSCTAMGTLALAMLAMAGGAWKTMHIVAENTQLNRDHRECQDDLASAQVELDRLAIRTASLEGEVEREERRANAAVHQSEVLGQALDKSEEARAAAERDKSAARRRTRALRAQLAELQAEVERATDAADTAADNAADNAAEQAAEIGDLRRRLNRARDQLDAADRSRFDAFVLRAQGHLCSSIEGACAARVAADLSRLEDAWRRCAEVDIEPVVVRRKEARAAEDPTTIHRGAVVFCDDVTVLSQH